MSVSSASASDLKTLSSSLLSLSTIAVALRFYARHTQRVRMESDDWIMIPCLLGFIGTTGCTFFGVRKKLLGYPTLEDPKEESSTAEMTLRLYFVFNLFSTTTLGLTKIGALLFFRRIFCKPGRRRTFFAHVTLTTIIFVALWTVALNVFSGLQCGIHFSALWSRTSGFAKFCHKRAWRFLLSLAVSDFLLEVWILSLPLPQIWAIQASVKRRFGIMGAFLLALVGFLACITRLVVTIQNFRAGPKSIIEGRLVNTTQCHMSVLENGLSLIAVNLPSIWCLFAKVKPESIRRSVRGIFSVHSRQSYTTSMGKPGSHSRLSSLSNNETVFTSSPSHSGHPKAQSIETYAMYDINERDQGARLPQGQIQITDTITQSAVHV